MKKKLYLLFCWFVKYGIWILLVLSIYMVLAAEFHKLCFIRLPFGNDTVYKLNSIGKNISLSYIAGVVFYFLSEYLPFHRKKRFVQDRCYYIITRMLDNIEQFLEELCGQKNMSDVNQLYFDAAQKEYNEKDVCKLSKNQLLAIRKLVVELDDTLNTVLLQDDYLEEEDYQTVLSLRTEAFLDNLRKMTQVSDVFTTDSKTLYIIIKGVVKMHGILNNLNVIRNYG